MNRLTSYWLMVCIACVVFLREARRARRHVHFERVEANEARRGGDRMWTQIGEWLLR
jgi:hypothetical protein